MSWELDTPEVPLKKSAALEKLEQMSLDQLNAMDRQEVNERIEEAAFGLARAYHKIKGSDCDTCIGIVHSALSQTGGALGGKVGAIMVATSVQAAENACRVVFTQEDK